MHRPQTRPRLAAVIVAGFAMVAVSCGSTMIGGDAAPVTAMSNPTSFAALGESATADETAASSTGSGSAGASATAAGTSPAPNSAPTLTETVTVVPTPQVPSAPVPEQSSSSPTGLPTDLAGEVYATVTSVNLANNTIDVDVLQWFTGQAAADACAEDGVEPIGAVCSAYYIRNTNPQLRTLTLGPSAVITVNPASEPANATQVPLSGLANRVSESSGAFFRLVVENSLVAEVEEVYIP